MFFINNLASTNKLHLKQQSLQGTCRSADKQVFVWLKVKFGTDESLTLHHCRGGMYLLMAA